MSLFIKWGGEVKQGHWRCPLSSQLSMLIMDLRSQIEMYYWRNGRPTRTYNRWSFVICMLFASLPWPVFVSLTLILILDPSKQFTKQTGKRWKKLIEQKKVNTRSDLKLPRKHDPENVELKIENIQRWSLSFSTWQLHFLRPPCCKKRRSNWPCRCVLEAPGDDHTEGVFD